MRQAERDGVTINVVSTLISIGATAVLTAVGWHYNASSNDARLALTIAIAVVIGAMLFGALGLDFADGRRATLIRLVSAIGVLGALIVLITLAVLHVSAFFVSMASCAMFLTYLLFFRTVYLATSSSTTNPTITSGNSRT